MEDKVYGVFSGCYSDWNIHGYFKDRDSAEKYCAVKNNTNESEYEYYHDDYYIMEIEELTGDFKNVKLRYYHTVTFDFGRNDDDNTGMRQEEDRYDYYIGEDRKSKTTYNTFKDGSGWISFEFNCETRAKAEKIAQDKYYQFLYHHSQGNTYAKAAQLIGAKHR